MAWSLSPAITISLALKVRGCGLLTFILQSFNIDSVVLARSEAPLHVTQRMDHSRLLLLGFLLGLLLHNKPKGGREEDIESDQLVTTIRTSFLELSALSRLSWSFGTSSSP